jgi:hypothetical protein
MAPQDFNLIFYRKCLSQHNWAWRESKDPFDLYKHSANEEFLRSVANTNGKEYLKAFNDARTNFPSKTENTKPKPNTTMIQLTINIPEAAQLAEAIKGLTEALNSRPITAPVVTATQDGETTTTLYAGAGVTSGINSSASVDPAPKKRGRPAKVEAAAPVAASPEPAAEAPAPAAEAPAPAPAVEAEAAPAEQVLTGAELAKKAVAYFSGDDAIRTEMRARLVQFRNNDLGWNQPISKLEDPAMCYQFNEKLEELKAELDQREAGEI